MTDELHKCVVPRARSAGEPDLPRTAVNAEGKDVLPYHFGQQKHLILESVCKVVEDVKVRIRLPLAVAELELIIGRVCWRLPHPSTRPAASRFEQRLQHVRQ